LLAANLAAADLTTAAATRSTEVLLLTALVAQYAQQQQQAQFLSRFAILVYNRLKSEFHGEERWLLKKKKTLR
jgi:hypothetical protein